MIEFVIFIYALMLIVVYMSFDKEVITPCFLFTSGFLISFYFAYMYRDIMLLELHINTVLVYIFSLVTLYVTCLFVKSFWRKHKIEPTKVIVNKVYNDRLFFLLALNLCQTLILLNFYHKYTNSYDIRMIMTAIGVHHNTLMTGAASVLSHTPFYMKFFQLVNEPAAYIVAHIVVYNWVSKLKNSKLSYAYLLVSMLNSLLVGERSGSTNLLLALIILYIFIRRFAFGLKIKGSIIIKIAAVLLLLLIGFQQSLLILGRRTVIDQSLSDYLAFYMGGEVKNLDYYLNSGITNHFNEPFLAFTFSNIYNLLGGIFGSYTPPVATRFLSVNGFRTGNVASMLYPFYCDGGLFGVIALSAVVGFIVQSCYEIAKRNVYNTSISLPLYSIFALSLAMSFFSNRILGSNLFVAISCIAIGPFIFRFITDNRRKINLLH